MILAYIILFTLAGSVLSLAGSLLLLTKHKFTENFANLLVSFAAGVLIAVAFFDLIPEAMHEADGKEFMNIVLFGFILFFLAERFIRLFHHHHEHDGKPTTYLVLIGDGIHNFIDGVIITASFLTSIPLGITTSIAVAAHEIPQEIADMGILLSNGLSKKKALFFNFLSALTALVGAITAYFFADLIEQNIYIFLALTAGFFIYISASDLIPSLHEKLTNNKVLNTLVFLFGVVLVIIFTTFFEAH